MDGGFCASMRNSLAQIDSSRGQEYRDAWLDGARATQAIANKYRIPFLEIVLVISLVALIPAQKRVVNPKGIEPPPLKRA